MRACIPDWMVVRRLALAGVAAGAMAVGEALAQAEVPANPPPAGTQGAPPEKMEQPADPVIKPPSGIDPGLVKPPPDHGEATTPVIPPPPDVQPK